MTQETVWHWLRHLISFHSDNSILIYWKSVMSTVQLHRNHCLLRTEQMAVLTTPEFYKGLIRNWSFNILAKTYNVLCSVWYKTPTLFDLYVRSCYNKTFTTATWVNASCQYLYCFVIETLLLKIFCNFDCFLV